MLSAAAERGPTRPAAAPRRSPRARRRREVAVEAFREAISRRSAPRSRTSSRQLKASLEPDLILTHHREDRHQDHRLVSDLTWNTFRDHLILEYEIPKYDGDLGQPNLFVPLDEALARRKVGCCSSTSRASGRATGSTRRPSSG